MVASDGRTQVTIEYSSSRTTSFRMARACPGSVLNGGESHHHSSSTNGPTSSSCGKRSSQVYLDTFFSMMRPVRQTGTGPGPMHSGSQARQRKLCAQKEGWTSAHCPGPWTLALRASQSSVHRKKAGRVLIVQDHALWHSGQVKALCTERRLDECSLSRTMHSGTQGKSKLCAQKEGWTSAHCPEPCTLALRASQSSVHRKKAGRVLIVQAHALWHSGQVKALCTRRRLDECSLSLHRNSKNEVTIAYGQRATSPGQASHTSARWSNRSRLMDPSSPGKSTR